MLSDLTDRQLGYALLEKLKELERQQARTSRDIESIKRALELAGVRPTDLSETVMTLSDSVGRSELRYQRPGRICVPVSGG
jgi:hypothetical protein